MVRARCVIACVRCLRTCGTTDARIIFDAFGSLLSANEIDLGVSSRNSAGTVNVWLNTLIDLDVFWRMSSLLLLILNILMCYLLRCFRNRSDSINLIVSFPIASCNVNNVGVVNTVCNRSWP